MDFNKDVIINIIEKISEVSETPGKKKLQKIIYLIEEKGFDLGFDYRIYYYGPYSSDLDFAVREMNIDGLLTIDYSRSEHKIAVAEGISCSKDDNPIINEVIELYGKDSPSDLELCATALYVFKQVNDKTKVEEGVRKLKGTKYNSVQISRAIDKLVDTGYIL